MFKDILEFIFMTSIVAMMTFGILYSLTNKRVNPLPSGGGYKRLTLVET